MPAHKKTVLKEEKKALQVGKRISRENPKTLFYCAVETDSEGYANPDDFLPEAFDLVELVTDGIRPIKRGWWTGDRFDGAHLKDTERVLRWKRCEPIGPERANGL